jgi:Ni/Fe-hydrogenase subunit HybB-like protein
MSDTKTATGGTLLTPFNMVAGLILLVGSVITVLRFTGGLGAVSNLSDYNPWGLWIGFDLLVGVALAAGGFVTSAACYIFGLKRYHSAVRPAILTAFLGYALVVFALHYDVGRPWRLPYPFIVQPGTTSLLFAWPFTLPFYLLNTRRPHWSGWD